MEHLPTEIQDGPVIYEVIADGIVVLGNVSDVLGRKNPNLPEVPTVFGSVREDNDLCLDQVRDTTVFPNAAWPFTAENVERWGAKLTGDKAFGQQVWNLYKTSPDRSARERWAQLTSDMRTICGNLFNAKQLAHAQSEPVYSYLFTHRPASPVLSHTAGWPPSVAEGSSQYAFHTWDVLLLFNGTAGYSMEDDLTYTFKPLDFEVGDRFRAAVIEFAETGRIASWTTMRKDETGPIAVCSIGAE